MKYLCKNKLWEHLAYFGIKLLFILIAEFLLCRFTMLTTIWTDTECFPTKQLIFYSRAEFNWCFNLFDESLYNLFFSLCMAYMLKYASLVELNSLKSFFEMELKWLLRKYAHFRKYGGHNVTDGLLSMYGCLFLFVFV